MEEQEDEQHKFLNKLAPQIGWFVIIIGGVILFCAVFGLLSWGISVVFVAVLEFLYNYWKFILIGIVIVIIFIRISTMFIHTNKIKKGG